MCTPNSEERAHVVVSLADILLYMFAVSLLCVLWPWREPFIANCLLVVLLPACIAIYRTIGILSSWLYAFVVSSVILIVDALVLGSDNRARHAPWWVTIDALWAALIIGTLSWALMLGVILMCKLCATFCRRATTPSKVDDAKRE